MDPATAPDPAPRVRQLPLIAVENPLGTRLGAEFFRALPPRPGVYFFHDADGVLLYIGQSNNLRARVGSYRHVNSARHPRRTLRLVHRIARIEWRECATPAAAQDLERELLLEKRPPFNRAGTWPGYPWWLSVLAAEEHVEVRLSRHPMAPPGGIGPLPAAFRHVHGSLVRCVCRLLHPAWRLSEYPLGLLNHAAPLLVRLPARDPAATAGTLTAFATGSGGPLLAQLSSLPEGAPPLETEYWAAEVEALQKFAAKQKMLPIPTLAFPAPAALPLFPDL